MKKIIISAALMLFATSSQALVVNPVTGGYGEFYWDEGLGDSVMFGGLYPGDDDTLEITVAVDSYVSLFSARDDYIVGDEFSLEVDGSATSWTLIGTAGGYFLGEAEDIFLAAGTHTFDLTVTADCCGGGAGWWSMSAARDAPVDVPEPTTLALLGLGLLGFGFTRRKSA